MGAVPIYRKCEGNVSNTVPRREVPEARGQLPGLPSEDHSQQRK